MTLIRLSESVRQSEELKQLCYWHAFMLNSCLKDEDPTLNNTLITMIKTGGYGFDTVPGNRRYGET